ncbi:MAG TPA: hypothetical protein PKA64_23020, partial [Myxococcota bacterium]|nr:hypothetical protein [Myxococcota bacterium]
HCVRKVDGGGIITTVAGVCNEPMDANDEGADLGDGGPATEAHLFSPYGVEVSGDLLYIADTENQAIRVVRL